LKRGHELNNIGASHPIESFVTT